MSTREAYQRHGESPRRCSVLTDRSLAATDAGRTYGKWTVARAVAPATLLPSSALVKLEKFSTLIARPNESAWLT
jgi:hypothetical protein